MLNKRLPQSLSQLIAAGRQALVYCGAASRALVGSLYRIESPRDAFRVALRQARSSGGPESTGNNPRAGGAAPLLIHYHIFKNAGTSFEWALERTYGDRFRCYDSPHPGGIVSSRELARLARAEPHLVAISSHQAVPPAPRIFGRKVLTSILIRDPISRIGSIYAFERGQKVETPGALKAKELDFKSYVQWRLANSPAIFCNYQVHFCSGRKLLFGDCSQRDLEAAIIRLDAIDIVGTVKRYAEWLALAEVLLGENAEGLTLERAHRNRSDSKSSESESEIHARLVRDLGSALTAELLRRNELDMCLYQVADALLTRRLAERSVLIELRNAYSKIGAAKG
ncbi:MAG: hypothetical protein H0W43_13345 [Chthoniobacterales bacterium]|jgi:hypothetical protein|nr:hypothetical protein [Chthoniobacterales bacterium]